VRESGHVHACLRVRVPNLVFPPICLRTYLFTGMC
jgi:hypothetical protein